MPPTVQPLLIVLPGDGVETSRDSVGKNEKDRRSRHPLAFSITFVLTADLANVINEPALLAGCRTADTVTLGDLEVAMERVVAGLEKRTRVMNEQERRAVACHECGAAP